MKWVEIITLRSPAKISAQFMEGILNEVRKSETTKNLLEIKVYHHFVVETDLSIHLYWQSEPESQKKTPLGLKIFYALKNQGLLNHSVWTEINGLELGNGLSRT